MWDKENVRVASGAVLEARGIYALELVWKIVLVAEKGLTRFSDRFM